MLTGKQVASKTKMRIGAQGEYHILTDGRYVTLNPQQGWVEVKPHQSRALALALREYRMAASTPGPAMLARRFTP